MVAPLGAGVAQTDEQFVGQGHAGAAGRERRYGTLFAAPAPNQSPQAESSLRLTLVVPDLVWPEPADTAALASLDLPGLEWLLARAEPTRLPRQSHEQALADCFAAGPTPPFGALRLLGEDDAALAAAARAGCWLCADPVHLRFHHERIVLADAGAFDLDATEAAALVAALNDQFADIGAFRMATPRRWYVRLQNDLSGATPPLSAVAGRRIAGELPDQETAARLQRWLNEIQMVLHGHPVNHAREDAGLPAVNSLWFWGAGRLAGTVAPAQRAVWSRDPLVKGLARAGGLAVDDPPADLSQLLVRPAGDHLVVADQLLAPVRYEDSTAWRDQLGHLERAWFAPLRQALGGPIRHLTLTAPTLYGRLEWSIAAGERWKFWRRPRTLQQLAGALAA